MKAICISALLLFVTINLLGQNITPPDTAKHVAKLDTINPDKGDVKGQLKVIKADKIKLHSDSVGPDSVANQPKISPKVDTVMQNKYGDLLRDDSAYNRKYSLWRPFLEVCGDNVALSLIDSRLLNLDFSKVNVTTWKRTIKAGFPWGPGWMWDQDRFGNNFLSHPIMGNFYYNASRCNGYNFWVASAFSFTGSYMWKIFGENGTPEREDIINTTADGILLGEILYRISSNILDDRTHGTERVFREILAGLIDPMRGFNRLIQGKTARYTNKEVYQKEPLNITLYAGIHAINDHSSAILSGTTSEMINVQFDYGNPFEDRTRNPFDFFKLRIETDIGVGRKIVDNVTGYGFLFGGNAQCGKVALLNGGFLYYDYWDNSTFELSTIALGAGSFSKIALSNNVNLYTNAHIGLVPLAGSSTGPITDTSQLRDYSYGYGWEAKFETSLALGKVATIGVTSFYYMIHLFNNTGRGEPQVGTLGNNSIGIVEPKITLNIYKDVSIGFQYYLYSQVHTENNYPTFTAVQTEQKIFIQFYFEDPQRRGHYN
ncbi:MAG TPA: DUF3943 domain-containing protein [Bacteroidia bacterium]|jgi:hypothetical protein|nr:DUF3943 domain-containing protein [Bacteroidia bacterium]